VCQEGGGKMTNDERLDSGDAGWLGGALFIL
jgi:hypothetical protein